MKIETLIIRKKRSITNLSNSNEKEFAYTIRKGPITIKIKSI